MDLLKFINRQVIFEKLTQQEKKLVSEHLQLFLYRPGDHIIQENDISQDLYFIKEGEAEVLKKNEKTDQEFVIRQLKSGDVIGEVSFIDRQPRSSSVRVIKRPASVYKFSVNWSDPDLSAIYSKMLERVVQESTSRLRIINQNYVHNLKDQIKEINEQNHFGYFFIFMVVVYGLNSLAKIFLSFHLTQSHFLSLMNFALLIFLPTASFIYYMDDSFADFGLTLKRMKQTLKETLALAVVGSLLFGLIYSTWAGWSAFVKYLSIVLPYFLTKDAVAIFLYIFAIEFAIRGVIQTSLQKFLSRYKEIGAILLTATLLWPTKLYLGLGVSFLNFLLDLFLGYLFMRQKNLSGVILLHYLVIMFSRTLV